MSHERTEFSLFSRLVVVLLSAIVVLVSLNGFVLGFRNGGPELVDLFLQLTLGAIGCYGVRLGLFYKTRSAQDLASEASLPSAERPNISDDALIFCFQSGSKVAAIYIDRPNQLIHFHNCHAPRRFLSMYSEWYSCPITQIQAAFDFRYRGQSSLTVVTTAGRALIAGTANDFDQLRAIMKELVPYAPYGYSLDHPLMGMVAVGGAFAGIMAGVSMTPVAAPDSTLGMFVLAGAAGGIGVSYSLVWASERLLRVSLVQPLGFAIIGAISGMGISAPLGPQFGWSLLPVVVLVGGGAVAGACFGYWKQTTETCAK